MSTRKYYSIRTRKNPNTIIPLDVLNSLFADSYGIYVANGYFHEAFGFECVDAGYTPGTLGLNIESQIFKVLRKPNLWPISDYASHYSEDDLFDMIEFLYDYISKPIKKEEEYHSWGNCGYHYSTFLKREGQEEFRKEINGLLIDYGNGFELSTKGEILILGEKGLNLLLEAPIPSYDSENIDKRVELAVQKFRRAKSTVCKRPDKMVE
jgi:hypothetical protein